MTDYLRRVPDQILASHPSLRITNPDHDGKFYLGVINIVHGDVDMQMLHKVSIARLSVDLVWTAAAYRGNVTIPLVTRPSEWLWFPEETLGDNLRGNLALTKGGFAEHSAQAEAVFPATPKVPAAIVRNVYYAPNPAGVVRAQPHHSLAIEWGLFEDGKFVDDVSRYPALVEELFS